VFELHGMRLEDDAADDGWSPTGVAPYRSGERSGVRGALLAGVSGAAAPLAEHGRGLPDGPAGAEALAVRLSRLGARLRWGEPDVVTGPAALLDIIRSWGAASVHVVRADPSLLPELALGSWFDAAAGARAVRRLAYRDLFLGGLSRVPALLRAAQDGAFWCGVRAEATEEEWRRLTSGYSALLYHRLSGELKPGQERLDVPWRNFERQMHLLRRLGFTPLSPKELADHYLPGGRPFPRRCVLVTLDDAFRDIVEPVSRHAELHPLLFVPTGDVGRRAQWLDDEEVASWEELAALVRAGVELGAHTRTHVDLPTVADASAEREIRGSAYDLRRIFGAPPLAFAYPYGRFGARERDLARSAGFALAFTTQRGRNGVGTDPFSLRRISVKAWDTRLSFVWKLVTGEQPPRAWERWLVLRAGIARRLAREHRRARAPARASATPNAAPPRQREP
jgi:peptidoglycan/xylan/chitin deacetylase (PgdA/CDA1 family)